MGVEVRGGSGRLRGQGRWIVWWYELSRGRGHGARCWNMGMLLRRRGVGMRGRRGRGDELLVQGGQALKGTGVVGVGENGGENGGGLLQEGAGVGARWRGGAGLDGVLEVGEFGEREGQQILLGANGGLKLQNRIIRRVAGLVENLQLLRRRAEMDPLSVEGLDLLVQR